MPEPIFGSSRSRLRRYVAFITGKVAGVSPTRRVSFSGGLVLTADGKSIAEAIERADQAMYGAETAGRDRLETALGTLGRADMPLQPPAGITMSR